MKPFRHIGGVKPGRSAFNLSYDKKLTCDMGQLIPVLCEEVVPGDIFKISNQIVLRFQPLVAPILHEVNVYVHYFFYPNRLAWDEWEDFITGGVDGDLEPTLPTWEPDPGVTNTIGSLWDYFGFPVGVDPAGAYPVDFPRRAYNTIYNEYYIDQNFMTPVGIDNEDVLYRCWEKDYFTSALPWQQRGTAPALPITGTSFAEWSADITSVNGSLAWPAVNNVTPSQSIQISTSTGVPANQYNPYDANSKAGLEKGTPTVDIDDTDLNNNVVDLSSAVTFNVADLRLAFQIQKWMERNARAGARYTEQLRAHFGVSPRDERLDRPEYIGGTKSPVVISEVLQTGETNTTPQGNLAGHGLTADANYAGSYRVEEFGVIIGIMSVMPRSAYQHGINRQWLKSTKYDYYFPEFAHLSEQAILQAELFASNVDTENETIFGYQGRFDEMRTKQSMICGEFRESGNFFYWHLGREFGSAPALNADFVEASDIRKDIFAVANEPGLLINFGNLIKAIRPIPVMSNPGFIDH